MERWLTVKEAAIELRVTTEQIKRMMGSGQLQYMRIGVKGEIRILDPAPALRQSIHEPRLDRFPLITAADLASVLGVSREVITWHVFKGHIKSQTKGRTQLILFTPKDVRRFIADREGRKRQSRYTYSATIVEWLKNYIADEMKPNGEIVSALIRDSLVLLPEPERSQAIAKVYGCVELVQKLIRDAKSKKSG